MLGNDKSDFSKILHLAYNQEHQTSSLNSTKNKIMTEQKDRICISSYTLEDYSNSLLMVRTVTYNACIYCWVCLKFFKERKVSEDEELPQQSWSSGL